MSEGSSNYGTTDFTPEGRLGYVWFKEPDPGPKKAKNKKSYVPKFKATLFVPKENQDELADLIQEIKDLAGVDKLSEMEYCPIFDGDASIAEDIENGKFEDEDDVPENDMRRGCIFLRANTEYDDFQKELFMIDEDDDEVPAEAKDFYAGCYGALLVTPFLYGEGEVKLILQGALKSEDGERIGGGVNVDTKSLVSNWKAKRSGGSTKKKKKSVEEDAPVETAKNKKPATKKKKSAPVEEPEDTGSEEETEEAPKKTRKKPTKSKKEVNSVLD